MTCSMSHSIALTQRARQVWVYRIAYVQQPTIIPENDVCAAEVKRKVSSEVLKEVGPLMKQYQEEVDKLSNRWEATNHSVPVCC